MKLHSTVQPMGFDSSGGANFRAYRFVENTPFGFWILACMEFHATVQPMGVDSSEAPNFCAYPYLETILLRFLQHYPQPLQPEITFPSTLHYKTELGLGG